MDTKMTQFICCPVDGKPYLVQSPYSSKEINSWFIIHPMFGVEDPAWKEVENIVKSKRYIKVYGEDNSLSYCVNTATITSPTKRSGCPHLFGDIYLEVSTTNYPFQTEEEYEKSYYSPSDDEDEA